YHQMRYIMEDEAQAANVADWDAWFGSFAAEVEDIELSSTGEYVPVTRLAGFINVPELRRMLGRYMDTVFSDDMPEMTPRETESGKTLTDESLTEAERAFLYNGLTEGAENRPYKRVVNMSADMTPAQETEFRRLARYAQEWASAGGKQRREWMLEGDPRSPIITDGLANKASYDVRMIDAAMVGMEGQTQDDPNSKASRVVAQVTEIYNSHPLASQVIFADTGYNTTTTRTRSLPGGDKVREKHEQFAPIKDIVERLVQNG